MKTLILMVGCPGSGKSTWIKNNGLIDYAISPDKLRVNYGGLETDLDGNKLITTKSEKKIWDMIFDIIEYRMKNGELIVVDATHSNNKLLNRYHNIAAQYRYRIIAIDFREVSIQTILERNLNRLENNPKKYIKPERLYTVHERLKTLELPNYMKIIKHDDNIEIQKLFNLLYNFDNFRAINAFGDIHGSYQELMKLINKAKDFYSKETFNVFLGDYFDRFRDEEDLYKLFEFLEKLDDTNLLLTGNHEYHIIHYDNWRILKENIQKIQNSLDKSESHIDGAENKLLQVELDFINNPILKKYIFDKYDIDFLKSTIDSETTDIYKFIISIILKLDIDESYRQKLIDKTKVFFKNFKIVKRLKNQILQKKADLKKAKKDYDEIRKLIPKDTRITFHKLTDKFGHKRVKNLFYRFAQIAFFEFRNKVYFLNHGGFPNIPTLLDKSKEFYYGVGSYGDEEKIIDSWTKNTPENYFQIFGHRNINNVNPSSFLLEGKRGIILNGDAEQGGPEAKLYGVVIEEDNLTFIDEVSVFEPTETVKIFRQNKFNKHLIEKDTDFSDPNFSILQSVKKHRGINIIPVIPEENIYSINFKSSVFKSGEWDNLSIHARGLFVQDLS